MHNDFPAIPVSALRQSMARSINGWRKHYAAICKDRPQDRAHMSGVFKHRIQGLMDFALQAGMCDLAGWEVTEKRHTSHLPYVAINNWARRYFK